MKFTLYTWNCIVGIVFLTDSRQSWLPLKRMFYLNLKIHSMLVYPYLSLNCYIFRLRPLCDFYLVSWKSILLCWILLYFKLLYNFTMKSVIFFLCLWNFIELNYYEFYFIFDNKFDLKHENVSVWCLMYWKTLYWWGIDFRWNLQDHRDMKIKSLPVFFHVWFIAQDIDIPENKVSWIYPRQWTREIEVTRKVSVL